MTIRFLDTETPITRKAGRRAMYKFLIEHPETLEEFGRLQQRRKAGAALTPEDEKLVRDVFDSELVVIDEGADITFRPLPIPDRIRLHQLASAGEDDYGVHTAEAAAEIIAKYLVSIDGLEGKPSPKALLSIADPSVFWDIVSTMLVASGLEKDAEKNSESSSADTSPASDLITDAAVPREARTAASPPEESPS